MTAVARILIVAKGPPDRGGISAFVQQLLGGPLAEEHEVELLNLTRADEVSRGGKLTSANVTRTLVDARALWRAAAAVDVVHLHTAMEPAVTAVRAGLLVLAARLRRTPVVVHVHGGRLGAWMRTAAHRLLVRVLLTPARVIVAVSTEGQKALDRVAGGKVHLVPNGVDLERFQPGHPRNSAPCVLYAGLLTPRKGVVDLLQASEALRSRGVPHELWLAGGTPDEGPEAERAVRAAAGPEVRFLGPQPYESMAELYRQADVFCLPSWWEAMPLSVLEAMASGLPVVATTVGEVPQVVDPGRSGYLVPPRDPAALADALERLLVDVDARQRMGTESRRIAAERFDARANADAMSRLLRAVAQSGP